ncbi:conjugation peptidase TraF [Azospirillum brasilense]|nr:conjugation peptidase TraF [Azospirillum brasilense]
MRVNTSPSIPVGFYLARAERAPTVGDTVFVCPPDTTAFQLALARGYIGAGPCGGRYEHVFKVILAAKSDVVEIGAEGVRVNGRLLPASAPMDTDAAGRALPALRYGPQTLPPGAVLLMTENPRSFDARYFGPLDASHIDAVVTPLLTWSE